MQCIQIPISLHLIARRFFACVRCRRDECAARCSCTAQTDFRAFDRPPARTLLLHIGTCSLLIVCLVVSCSVFCTEGVLACPLGVTELCGACEC